MNALKIAQKINAPLKGSRRLARVGRNAGATVNKNVNKGAHSAKAASENALGAALNASGGSLAKADPAQKRAAEQDLPPLLETEYRNEPPNGLEAAMFKQLPRPRLTERVAAELTTEQARAHVKNAGRFYQYEFPLFPRGDFFYEEIEEGYLTQVLGADDDSIDRRFIDVTTLFRRTLNANTRHLLFYWMPLIGFFLFAAAMLATVRYDLRADVVFASAAGAASFLMLLVYSWPYKVVQQRNLMNLDNYITSKFARINNNFQVAKRRALNVEREKRMNERDALKEEAGAWTLAYHWFATRLFLCETMLRNKLYQVRRNTSLYWIGGLFATAAALVADGAAFVALGASQKHLLMFAGGACVYFLFAGAVTGRAAIMMFDVLRSNEWSRFHLINLGGAIRDHVGEDKLQIITFRDRNRFE